MQRYDWKRVNEQHVRCGSIDGNKVLHTCRLGASIIGKLSEAKEIEESREVRQVVFKEQSIKGIGRPIYHEHVLKCYS